MAGRREGSNQLMRIAMHDYGGYGFPPQLSRELARRGHEVLHLYCAEVSTDKGRLERTADDPPTFNIEGVEIGEPMQKYSMTKRFPLEWKYGTRAGLRIKLFKPDVVISANTPLIAQYRIVKALDKSTKFVVWQQDLVSFAMRDILSAKIPVAGSLGGKAFVALEKWLTNQADQVVVISDDFVEAIKPWGIDEKNITVIENWAPLDELTPQLKDNAWSREHNLNDKIVFMYSGVLGIKHNPEMLLDLAKGVEGTGAQVVVTSGGIGAEWLTEHGVNQANLHVLGFQPYEVFANVLGTADVLVSILEPNAGVFSVPSKVLTYHSAGRSILAAIPKENLAAKIISSNGSGVVVTPGDTESFTTAAKSLAADDERRNAQGRLAREYAESTFAISGIADKFEKVLQS